MSTPDAAPSSTPPVGTPPTPTAAPVAPSEGVERPKAEAPAAPAQPSKASDVLRRLQAEASASPAASAETAQPSTTTGGAESAEASASEPVDEEDSEVRRRLEKLAKVAERTRRDRQEAKKERKAQSTRLERMEKIEAALQSGDELAALELILPEDRRDKTFQNWAKKLFADTQPRPEPTAEELEAKRQEELRKQVAAEIDARKKAEEEAAAKAKQEKYDAAATGYLDVTTRIMTMTPERWPRVAAMLAAGRTPSGEPFEKRDILTYVELHRAETAKETGRGVTPDPEDVLDAYEVHFGGRSQSKGATAGAGQHTPAIEGQTAERSSSSGTSPSDWATSASPKGSPPAPKPNDEPGDPIKASLRRAMKAAGLL